MIVDAHQHFWNPARGDYGWLTPDLPIHRVYGPADLQPLMRKAGVDATIIVQAAPTAAETDYMLALARTTPWVLGVVGWIDLEAPDAAAQIRARADDPLMLGIRPMLQDIPQHDWILRPELAPALTATADSGLVFDTLVLPHQLGVAAELAARHSNLTMVLDHGAKPKLGNAAAMQTWRDGMARLAQHANVTCKFSGLLTELPPGGGAAQIAEAAETLFDLFGPERLIWGSDWPVLTLAGSYEAWFAQARDLAAARWPDAVPAIFGGNARRIYRPSRLIRASDSP